MGNTCNDVAALTMGSKDNWGGSTGHDGAALTMGSTDDGQQRQLGGAALITMAQH